MKKRLIITLISLSSLSIFATQKDTTITLNVQGNCDMCKQRIETAAQKAGALNPSWHDNTQILQLSIPSNNFQNTQKNIINAILDAGHQVNHLPPNPIAYANLPECCLYKTTSDSNTPHQPQNQDASAIRGILLTNSQNGTFSPFLNAHISPLSSPQHIPIDAMGVFKIYYDSLPFAFSVQTPFSIDTFTILNPKQVLIIKIDTFKSLQNLLITSHKKGASISSFDATFVTLISQKELFKAACCNLSESFETNASIDIHFRDAVSGRKHIQMLGLSSNYSLLTINNLPTLRGLTTYQGLNFISGTFIENIALTKGIGSVVNGFESIASHINIELLKPYTAPPFYFNIYINNFGKTDLNTNLSLQVSKKWKTILMLHNSFLSNNNPFNATMDIDNNSFKDMPTGNLFTFQNTWQYDPISNWTILLNLAWLSDNQLGGQHNFNINTDKFTTNAYGMGWTTQKTDLNAKIGYVFPMQKYKSLGFQIAFYDFNNQAFFGLTAYNQYQQSLYTNMIYQSIIQNTNHKFKIGASSQYDAYAENINTTPFQRTEYTLGTYTEYQFSYLKKINLLAGIRLDYNNLFGPFFTPRFNLKYNLTPKAALRFIFGRGQRTANIFSENTSIFMNNRQLNLSLYTKTAYGFQPEIAWNFGFAYDHNFHIAHLPFTIILDIFQTSFQNQVVLNLEKPHHIAFQTLNGTSFSKTFQIELQTTIAKKLDIKSVYRFSDIQTTYDTTTLQKPFVSPHKLFLDLDYNLKKIRFNITLNWYSSKRIPPTQNDYQYTLSSPYTIINAQITFNLGKKQKSYFYIGAENLTNFVQPNAIIDPSQPFSKNFDASLIWAPTFGTMVYSGLRYTL